MKDLSFIPNIHQIREKVYICEGKYMCYICNKYNSRKLWYVKQHIIRSHTWILETLREEMMLLHRHI